MIDGNEKAKQNLDSLNKQIQNESTSSFAKSQERFFEMLMGMGSNKKEPDLPGFAFWIKMKTSIMKALNQWCKQMN